MKMYLTALLGVVLCPLVQAQDQGTYQKDVAIWYEAFNQKDPALLDRILSKRWVDIPAPADQAPGSAGAKLLLIGLNTTT